MRVGIVALVSGCVVGSRDLGQSKSITLILGQSNAEGQGNVTEVAPEWAQSFDAVRLTTHLGTGPGTFADYDGKLAPRADHKFGAELSLGRAMQGQDIAVCAVSGTSLAFHWNPSGSYPAAGAGNLYHLAIAYAHALEMSRGASVTAIVWMQGESDAGNEVQSLAYGDNLANISALLLAEFPRARFFYYRLSSGMSITYKANVIAGQEANSGGAWMTMIDVDALGVGALHFTSAGYLDLGTLVASTIQAAGQRPSP